MPAPQRLTRAKRQPGSGAGAQKPDQRPVSDESDAGQATAKVLAALEQEAQGSAGTDAPADPPQGPPERPEPVAEGKDTRGGSVEAQAPAEPVKPVEEEAAQRDQASATAEKGDTRDGETQADPAASGAAAPADLDQQRAELIIPSPEPQIPFGRIMRSTPEMDPTIRAMYNDQITRLLKSVRNVANMLHQRQTEYEAMVRLARGAGFPEEDLQRLAITHDWEVPAPPTQ